MAAVTPVSANNCRGQLEDGTANIQLKCVRGQDDQGDDVLTCATMRYFYKQCPLTHVACNSLEGAYVAAITVCRQGLFS